MLPVNEAFLVDLEKMIAPNGYNLVGGVGDVALKHLKELRGFEQYRQYYAKREEAQAIFEEAVSKGTSGFASYIDVRKFIHIARSPLNPFFSILNTNPRTRTIE